MNRENGFYWIMLHDKWIVSEWHHNEWLIPGYDIDDWQDHDLQKIDDKQIFRP